MSRWPALIERRFVELWTAGAEVSVIAEAIGKTPREVTLKAHRMAKRGAVTARGQNTFTEQEAARLAKEYDAAANAGKARELAAEMGRTAQYLSRQAGKLGLTKYQRKRSYNADNSSKFMKAWHTLNDHPRGMLGKTHTAETKARLGVTGAEMWRARSEDEQSELTSRQLKTKLAKYGTLAPPRLGTTWKADWRTIGGERSFYRSMWEANYARYLEWLRAGGHIKSWEHEPKTFWFEAIKRGARSYLPDFRVTENNGSIAYHEVKGWMDDRSKTKIKRMRIYYPDVKLIVVDAKGYRAIMRQAASLVPGWESQAVIDPNQGTLFAARAE